MPKYFICSVRLLVEADSESEAHDFVYDLLEAQDGVVDWGYENPDSRVFAGGLREITLPLPGKGGYDEGDLFSIT